MESEIFKSFIEYIKLQWHRKSTLLILVLLSALALLYVFSDVKLEEVSFSEYLVGLVLIGIVCLIWFVSSRVPKPQKGKVGIAIAITSDNPSQYKVITNDFIQRIKEFAYKDNPDNNFQVIEFPEYFSRNIETSDDAINLLRRSQCHFLLYGKARTAKLKGELLHVLDLEGAVTHRPIPTSIGKNFSLEFSDLFPRKLHISTDGELFSFQFTANLIHVVARYIIANASIFSRDPDYAQVLLEDLLNQLNRQKNNLPSLVKIKQRTPILLREIYLYKVGHYYDEWKYKKELEILLKIEPYVGKILAIFPNDANARNFNAILIFLKERNLPKAKAEVLKSRDRKHTTWRYNLAFLFAYEGNLEKAEREYKSAFRGHLDEPMIALDVIEFMIWILEIEPQKVQLHYCIGLMYYHVVKDYILALDEFRKFLDTNQNEVFINQRDDVQKYISELAILTEKENREL